MWLGRRNCVVSNASAQECESKLREAITSYKCLPESDRFGPMDQMIRKIIYRNARNLLSARKKEFLVKFPPRTWFDTMPISDTEAENSKKMQELERKTVQDILKGFGLE